MLDARHTLICRKIEFRKTSGDFVFYLGEVRDYKIQSDRDR